MDVFFNFLKLPNILLLIKNQSIYFIIINLVNQDCIFSVNVIAIVFHIFWYVLFFWNLIYICKV